MRKWNAPEVTELNISCTEQGKNISTNYDEVRVDQNGNYWYSFSSGVDSKVETDGNIYLPEEE